MLDATPLLRLYARHRSARLAAENAADAQTHQLLSLVYRARSTKFGSDHGFSRIRSVADYQQRVPLRRYEDFWRDYWQSPFPRLTNLTWPGTIPYFAETAGTTTGRTKFIPVSRAINASNRRAALDVLTHHIAAQPSSRILGGKNFLLGGSTDLTRRAPGIYSGDLSGIAANEVPWWARPRFFPPRRYALLANWDEKIDRLTRLSLTQDIRSLSGTPSWVLLFFARLAELRPDLPRRSTSYFPNLELFIHGGVNFAPYRPQFEELLRGSHAEMREVYPASEGFVAIADRGYGEGLRLIADIGVFYEFVPAEEIDTPRPTRHWIGTVETGINYAVVLSTCAGLWSYVLGDTIRFVDLRPPRLMITGRLSYFLSAFGEHLIAEEIETAVAAAAAAIESQVTDFTVTPLFPTLPQERGGHVYIVEFATAVDKARVARFARTLDANLGSQNKDYRDHRAGSFGMEPPRVVAVAPGSFAAWMKAHGKLGGQHKVPRVIHDRALFHDLEEFLRQQDAPTASSTSPP